MVAPGGSFDSIFEEMEASHHCKKLNHHTSGFTYGENVTGFEDVAKQYDEENAIPVRVLELLAQVPLVAQPGTTFNYSTARMSGCDEKKISGKKPGSSCKKDLSIQNG